MKLDQKKRKLADERDCFRPEIKRLLPKFCRKKTSGPTCHGVHVAPMCYSNRKATHVKVKEVLTVSVHLGSLIRGIIVCGRQTIFVREVISRKLQIHVPEETNM